MRRVGAAFEDAAEGGSGVFVGVELVECADGGRKRFSDELQVLQGS